LEKVSFILSRKMFYFYVFFHQDQELGRGGHGNGMR